MTDHPIIFSAPMIRAILDGSKTQTRRVLKPQPHQNDVGLWVFKSTDGFLQCQHPSKAPFITHQLPFSSGDRLWVRESWNAFQFSQDGDEAWPCDKIPTLDEINEIKEAAHRVSPPQAVYRESDRARKWFADQKWRPSIHMPRSFSRLTLIVEDVRVQRLQQINRGDAMAEGCDFPNMAEGPDPRDWFRDLWDGLNAKRGSGWEANPWVVAITFRTIKANIDREASL